MYKRQDYLFHAYADRPEGDLTRIRASLVSESALFQFAQEIDLGEYLRLGREMCIRDSCRADLLQQPEG